RVHSRACMQVNSTASETPQPLTSACLGHQNCPLALRGLSRRQSSHRRYKEPTRVRETKSPLLALHLAGISIDGLHPSQTERTREDHQARENCCLHHPPAKHRGQYLLCPLYESRRQTRDI